MAKSSIKFLADQNISPKVIDILHHLHEKSITSLRREKDLVDTADSYWVPAATQRGYICITCDFHMTAELAMAQILINERPRVIFLESHFADSTPWDQALWLLKHWKKIKAYAEKMTKGQLIRVLTNGKIVAVKPGQKRRRPPARRPANRQAPSAKSTPQGVIEFQ